MKRIKTKDPKVALINICRRNCNKMRTLADLTKSVLEFKKKCGNRGEFTSARTPECLDKIMEELVYAFTCESDCDMTLACRVVSGEEVEVPAYFDGNCPKEDGE